mmetsp:Transcript_49104/g.141172  ORF Transcript_49104/g.141172 Transcript_49104/m.141172 type:complete len:324 (+) Transcript_49104:1060-2031(+)
MLGQRLRCQFNTMHEVEGIARVVQQLDHRGLLGTDVRQKARLDEAFSQGRRESLNGIRILHDDQDWDLQALLDRKLDDGFLLRIAIRQRLRLSDLPRQVTPLKPARGNPMLLVGQLPAVTKLERVCLAAGMVLDDAADQANRADPGGVHAPFRVLGLDDDAIANNWTTCCHRLCSASVQEIRRIEGDRLVVLLQVRHLRGLTQGSGQAEDAGVRHETLQPAQDRLDVLVLHVVCSVSPVALEHLQPQAPSVLLDKAGLPVRHVWHVAPHNVVHTFGPRPDLPIGLLDLALYRHRAIAIGTEVFPVALDPAIQVQLPQPIVDPS